MKNVMTILLAAIALAVGSITGAQAQTTNLTADGKATTTQSGGRWDLKVDGRTIATGLFSRPTCDADGKVFIIEKPQGTKTPVDRQGNKVQAQQITQDQIYNETVAKIEAEGGVTTDPAVIARRAAAAEAERARKDAAEKVRADARMAEVQPDAIPIEGVGVDIMMRGKLVMRVTSFKMDVADIYARYWFSIVEKDGKYGFIAIDTETGAYTQLLPFEYNSIRAANTPGQIICSRSGSTERYRLNGKSDLTFELVASN